MADISSTKVYITPGYRSVTDVTVTNSAAGTFTARYSDMWGNDLGTVTTSAPNATTIRMTIADTETADITQPPNLPGREVECEFGRWYLMLDDGNVAGDLVVAVGKIIYQRVYNDGYRG